MTPRDRADYFRKYRAQNLERMREYQREHKRKRREANPGLTAHYTAKMRERKATRPRPFMCEICDKSGPVVWDHCHATGLFRGWLCDTCNKTLGVVRDSQERLMRMIAYLERFEKSAKRR